MAINYPVSTFRFQVEWQGTRIGFTEVSGLNVTLQPIEYRSSDAGDFQVTKMPGIPQFDDVVCKRGIFVDDNEFFIWLNTVRMSKIERRTITVSLLNEDGDPLMVWKINDAWPTKVEGPSLNSTGNEVAIESITLAHEGLTIETV